MSTRCATLQVTGMHDGFCEFEETQLLTGKEEVALDGNIRLASASSVMELTKSRIMENCNCTHIQQYLPNIS